MAHQNQNPNEAQRKHSYTNQRTGHWCKLTTGGWSPTWIFRDNQNIQNPLGYKDATKMKIKLTVNMLTQLSRFIPSSPVGCAR